MSLHHLEWGISGQHPIVLVHGSRLHAHVWNHFSRRFNDRYHVIAVDQRGHGDSDWSAGESYRVEDFYRDLRAVTEARGLRRFTLIGHSLGGKVCMLYAHRHPEALERLILVDITAATPAVRAGGSDVAATPHPGRFDSPEAATAYLARLMPRAPRNMLEESVRHGMRRTDDGGYTWKYDPAMLRRERSAAADLDFWSIVKCVPTPTLLQYGGVSNVVTPELAARMASSMPHCAVERIDGAGHGLFTDQPEMFAESVERFLNGSRE
jgi:pimeloyl-ACP methyl ester carboxylesterase